MHYFPDSECLSGFFLKIHINMTIVNFLFLSRNIINLRSAVRLERRLFLNLTLELKMEILSISEIDQVSGAGLAQVLSSAGTTAGFAAIGFSVGGPIGGVAGAMFGAGVSYGYFKHCMK